MVDKNDIVIQLVKAGVVKFGNFQLKSKKFSPYYLDFRVVISNPKLLNSLSKLMWTAVASNNESFIKPQLVCGVPYGAISLAVAVSINEDIPLVMKRKEQKSHGTKAAIEGNYQSDQTCLIIEDVVTTGSSIIETTDALRSLGIAVSDAVVIMNREQPESVLNLAEAKIRLHHLFTVSEFMNIAFKHCLITEAQFNQITQYINDSKSQSSGINLSRVNHITKDHMNLPEWVKKFPSNSFTCELAQIIKTKKTNVCVAIDSTDSEDFLRICLEVGPHVCMIKTHLDAISDLDENTVSSLHYYAKQYKFKILEDRKFADIGATNSLQLLNKMYSNGTTSNCRYSIAEIADAVTVHAFPGIDSVKALATIAESGKYRVKSIFLVSQMSSSGSEKAFTPDYEQYCCEIAQEIPNVVSGFICQKPPNFSADQSSELDKCFFLTPGVSLNQTTDDKGQQYRSPADAINQGNHIVIVGRAITHHANPGAVCEKIKQISLEALCKRFQFS